MPRGRKKKEPIIGIGDKPDEKLVVQKCHPLMILSQSELTLPEFKILDLYLARIDSHHPEKRAVTLEKGEIERALGVKRISIDDLAERIVNLGEGIKVPDPTKKTGFRVIWLLEEAHCVQDDDSGLWTVTLEASAKGIKYFFNVDDLGYFRYKLRCVSGLTSRYSYILFLYLEENRFRKTWEVELDELKKFLSCDKEETYKQYKRFNDLILKKCHKELAEKSECRFTYDPIKKGRSVVAIRFTLETLKDLEPPEDPNQITIDDFCDGKNPMQDYLDLLGSACCPETDASGQAVCEFTQTELQQIAEVVDQVPAGKLPANQYSADLQKYHYLREKYAALNRAAARRPIKYRCSYLITMIKKDCES